MKTKSKELGVVEFGRQLVESLDLDPVYVILHKAKLQPKVLEKWLLAYFCFYHCGTASWITERSVTEGTQDLYWWRMEQAALSSERPRGTERRHFRGLKAIKAVDWLKEVGIDYLFGPFRGKKTGPLPLATVMKEVQEWPQFGPWISFKVADMLDRLGITKISFSAADTFLFDSPREGAAIVVARYANGEHVPTEKEPAWAFRFLEKNLGHLEAPPLFERKLNGQEYETILCKWKSYLGGHYHVGKDLHEIREGLLRFATCKTAQLLLKELPKCLD